MSMTHNDVFYGDFSGIDTSSISTDLSSFGHRNDQNFGGTLIKSEQSLYQGHFMAIANNNPGVQGSYNGSLNVIPPPSSISPHGMSQITSQQMPQLTNGNSDDMSDKEMNSVTFGANQSSAILHQQQTGVPLAKPVPVRRLSEKRLAQTRACFSTPSDILLESNFAATSPSLARALIAIQQTQRRQRSEKKTIPCEQKDSKYFERRHRNNFAAKRSRDARKAREDEIAIRASFLEKENAILRAQVATLREEANSLRQLLLQKRNRH